MPQAEWFIGHDGRRLGPYSDRVIRELAARGRLAPGDLLWTPGMERWQRADECAALSLFDAAPTTSTESSAAPVITTCAGWRANSVAASPYVAANIPNCGAIPAKASSVF